MRINFSPSVQLFWVVTALSLASLVTSAVAQDLPTIPANPPPMRFVVVRSSEPACEPTCPEWISAEGRIVADSAAQFRKLLKRLKGRRLPVVLYSSGGHLEPALAIGRLIRSNGLDTMVAKTNFVGCSPDDKQCSQKSRYTKTYSGTTEASGAICSSACVVMLAGGIRRLANCEPCVGIHEVVRARESSDNDLYDIRPISIKYKKRLEDYFVEMKAGFWVVSAMMKTPHNEIRYLLTHELMDLNLISVQGRGDIFTGSDVCNATPLPANCRTITENMK